MKKLLLFHSFYFFLLMIACNKEMISSTENIPDKKSSPTGSIRFQYTKIDRGVHQKNRRLILQRCMNCRKSNG